MLELNVKPLRAYLTAGMLAFAVSAAVLPIEAAWAQARA